uniref:Uncharacterized protein n=1 Tax=Panagrolaimus sp. JU765 TaxID=591449 RepID=A0AC34QJ54_9BILA
MDPSSSRIILIEDIFHFHSYRRPFSDFCAKHGFKFVMVKVNCSLNDAIEFNQKRKPDFLEIVQLTVTTPMLTNIYNRFEDDPKALIVDTKMDETQVLTLLRKKIAETKVEVRKMVPPRIHPMTELTDAEIFDSMTRKVTNKIISHGFQDRAKEINDFRREFLKQKSRNVDEKQFEDLILKFLNKT